MGLISSSLKGRGKPLIIVCALVLLSVGPIVCLGGFFQRPGIEKYEAGFKTWVATDVNDSAIRAWAAGLPPSNVPAQIPVSTWPTSITTFAPRTVEHHPNQGVVLHWGVAASWGTSRKVFVGLTPLASPPTDPFHPQWAAIRPDLWMAIGITN